MSLFLDPRTSITSKRVQRSLAARGKQRRRQSSLEQLETRQLLTYTFSLAGSTATATGNNAADTLAVGAFGGFLFNRVNGGLPSMDWDTATPGTQTLAASPASTVNIAQASGAVDLVSSSAVGASLNTTKFNLTTGGGTSSLTVDDTADATPGQVYNINDATVPSITGPGILVNDNVSQPGGITVKGGTGGNTFNVLSTFAPAAVSVVAKGADTVVVGTAAAGMTNIHSDVTITDTAGKANVTLNDAVDATGKVVTVGATSTTGLTTAGAINYPNAAQIASLTIDGGTGGNTFTVTNTIAGITTNLNSGTGLDTVNVQATSLGSTLNVHGQNGFIDTVKITNAGSVQGILGNVTVDNVGGLTDMTVDDSADATGRTSTLAGNVGGTSTLTGLAPGSITATTADITSYSIINGLGNDNFTVDFTNGNPIPANTFPSYDGGGGTNTLNLVGGTFANETVTPSGPNSGTITLDTSVIKYTNVQNINDKSTITNNYTFNVPSGPQSISVTNGTFLGNTTLHVHSLNTPPSFSDADIYGKTNVFIVMGKPSALNNDQQVLLDAPAMPTGVSTLTITTDSGNDNVSVRHTPAGVHTTIDTDGNDTVSVFGPGVAAAGLSLDGGPGGTDTLNYDAGGLTPTVVNGPLPGEVMISVPGAGTVDAVNFEIVNITNTTNFTPVVTGLTINTVEGARLVNVAVATFIDTDPGAKPSDYAATINWGDGTSSAGVILQDAVNPTLFFVEGSHTYTEQNPLAGTPAVVVSDHGNTFTSVQVIAGAPVTVTTTTAASTAAPATFTANIVQGPIAVSALPLSATEGIALTAGQPLATFIDAGGAKPASDYTATYNVLNSLGVSVTSGSLTANITQVGNSAAYTITAPGLTLAEEGVYTLRITVTDEGVPAATFTAASQVVVADAILTPGVQPLVPLVGTLNEGAVFNGAVSAFVDANPGATAADFTATIDWGDGSPTALGTITSVVNGAVTVSGRHVYTQEGIFTVHVVTVDDGGQKVSTTTTATVADPALSSSAGIQVRGVEGANTGQIAVATFTDPDPNSTISDWSATIAWGDGTSGPGTIVLIGGDPATGGHVFRVFGSHTYAEDTLGATPPLTAVVTTLTDVDTPATVVTVTGPIAIIADEALTSQGASVQGIEGNAITNQLIATFTDSNPAATVADFNTAPGSITVDWGDGTSTDVLPGSANITVTASGSANGVVFRVNGTHTYAEEGVYKVTVTIVDAGGATTIAHSEADIADARLSATAGQPTVTTTESPIFTVPVFGAPIFTGAVATFTDADPTPHPTAPVTDYTATIDWGDGTPQSAGTITVAAGIYTVTGSHTYADAGTGTYPITVYVVDEGGSKVTLHNIANVADNAVVLTGKLNPASDSGASNTDAITNVRQPSFFGTSEPLSHVTLFATPKGGGAAIQIGQGQAGIDRVWNITSNVPLADGSYVITATAVDQFGKTITAAPVVVTPTLLIDTVGPRITGTSFNRLNGEVDFTIRDFPSSGVNLNTLLDSANYQLTKIKGGRIGRFLVTNITVTPSGTPDGPVNVAVQFNGGRSIRGGFYLFTVRDSSRGPSTVQDIAGNSLDGEFFGNFPSGNGIPGGDFVAEIDAIHNRVFAPQTVTGTANPGNRGVGGAPVGAVHSGNFTIVNPQGNGSVFTAAKVRIRQAAPHGPRRHK